MCSDLGKPIYFHVWPASILFHIPCPDETFPLSVCSPSPTYITFESDSLTAIAPMLPPKNPSLIGTHVLPASSVFHTPPPAVPM